METIQHSYSDSKTFVQGIIMLACNHLEATEQFSVLKVSFILPRAAVMEY